MIPGLDDYIAGKIANPLQDPTGAAQELKPIRFMRHGRKWAIGITVNL